MGKNKYSQNAGSLCAIPNLGLLTFAIGASRTALGLVITLGTWRGNTPLGRTLSLLLWIAVVVLGVADKRPSCRNLGAAVGNVLVFVGGGLYLLALSKSPWAIAMGVWLAALLVMLFFCGWKQKPDSKGLRRRAARKN